MTKNPFNSISRIFKKGGNSIASTAKSIFSKSTADQFRNALQDTLKSQGSVLQTVGKITSGAALPLAIGASVFAPELIPIFAGLGAAGVGIGGTGMLESAGANLLSPKLYKGKNKLQTTGKVINEIERAAKGGTNITKFA